MVKDFRFAHPDDRTRVRRSYRDVLTGKTLEIKYRLLNPNGQIRHVQTITRPILDNRGKVTELHEVLQDVTRVTEAEERLQSALADAEQANQAKSEFLATMSHEFRTPLNAILGFSEMMREQYFGPLGAKNYQDYAYDIHDAGQHMLALTNDVLDIAAIEAGKREFNKKHIDVTEVLMECLRHFEHRVHNRNIALSLDIDDHLPALYADRRSVLQILLNLVSNAVKFTAPNGTVVISAGASDNGVLAITVSDTGVGIPAGMLPIITEPFTQSQSDPHLAEDGTGLGLSIVKALVQAHDGSLEIDSTVDVGTNVTVTLPSN